MLTMVLVVYIMAGVLFTLVSVSSQFDLYNQNDLINKGVIIAHLILGWPYYLLKTIMLNLKNC